MIFIELILQSDWSSKQPRWRWGVWCGEIQICKCALNRIVCTGNLTSTRKTLEDVIEALYSLEGMPPKRRRVQGREEADGAVVSKRPRKKSAWKMPPPLPAGEVLSDFEKKQWVLGTSVGKGGFGEIYLAAPHGSSASVASAKHVLKIVSGISAYKLRAGVLACMVCYPGAS